MRCSTRTGRSAGSCATRDRMRSSTVRCSCSWAIMGRASTAPPRFRCRATRCRSCSTRPGIVPAGVRLETLASSHGRPADGARPAGRLVRLEVLRAGRAVAGNRGRAVGHDAQQRDRDDAGRSSGGARDYAGRRRSTPSTREAGCVGWMRRRPEDRALIEDAIAYFQTADELYRGGGYRFEGPGVRTVARVASIGGR